jgi:hypothetical protein
MPTEIATAKTAAAAAAPFGHSKELERIGLL